MRKLRRDRGEKPITSARNGFNEARDVSRVGEGRAQFLDGSVEAVVKFDKGVGGPQTLPNFFPGYQLTRTLQQHLEHLERLVLKLDAKTSLGQNSLVEIRLEQAETYGPRFR